MISSGEHFFRVALNRNARNSPALESRPGNRKLKVSTMRESGGTLEAAQLHPRNGTRRTEIFGVTPATLPTMIERNQGDYQSDAKSDFSQPLASLILNRQLE
jgi:hypothetical protein